MKIFSLFISLLLIISCAQLIPDSDYEYRKELFETQLEGAIEKYLNCEFSCNENANKFSTTFTGADDVLLGLKSRKSWKCTKIEIIESTIKGRYRIYPFSKGLSISLANDDGSLYVLNYGFFKELIDNDFFRIIESSFNFEGWDYIYQQEYDEFDKNEVISLKPTYRTVLRSPEEDKHNHLWGSPVIIKENNKETVYLFIISYEASDWLFIQEENSLSVIADTLNYKFDTIKIDRETYSGILGARISELAYFQLTKDQMQNIFFAETLKFKINGKSRNLKTIVPNKTKLYFRKFLKSTKSLW